MNKALIITGYTGTVGSALLKRIKDKKRLFLVNRKGIFKKEIGKEEELICKNPYSKEVLRNIFLESDTCVHLINLYENGVCEEEELIQKHFKTNVLSALYFSKLAKETNLDKFVLASTTGIYYFFSKDTEVNEETLLESEELENLVYKDLGSGFLSPDLIKKLNPRLSYVFSKLLAEKIVKSILPEDKLLILRFANIFGGNNQEGTIIPKFIEKIKNNENLEVYNWTRNFIHIDEIVESIILSLEKNLTGIRNVINAEGSFSLVNLTKIIKELFPESSSEISVNDKIMEPNIIFKTLFNDFEKRKKINLKEGIKKYLHMDNIFEKFIRTGGDEPMNYEHNLLSRRWGHVKALLNGEPIPPFEIEIQTSSVCNLACYWCIGDNIQTMNQVTRLPNNITEQNVKNITQSLIDYKKSGMGIDVVKFSGFIGEPLVNKDATLLAIKHLTENGIKVGLFSNGIFLASKEVQDVVVNAEYIHISLDAGTAETFAYTKSKANYDLGKKNFELILNNINDLANLRKDKNTSLKLNVGFIANPHNFKEAYDISKKVKELGADSIRFKCDVAGRWPLNQEQIEIVNEQIQRAKKEIESMDFKVIQVHSEEEMKVSAKLSFEKCYSHHLWGTIGSDGNVYPCDFTTFPGAPHYGNVINKPFKDIWEGPLRKQIIGGIPSVCHKICSPFAIRINYFLNELKRVIDEKGIDFVEQQRTEFLEKKDRVGFIAQQNKETFLN